jgi:hypothetical protein
MIVSFGFDGSCKYTRFCRTLQSIKVRVIPAERGREVGFLLKKSIKTTLGLYGFSCNLLKLLVGAAGFELATPCAQGRCATRLRYAPTCLPMLPNCGRS